MKNKSIPLNILLFIQDNDKCLVSDIYRGIFSTYPYVSNICSSLESKKLITKEVKGRKTHLSLTEKGRKVASLQKQLNEALNHE